MTKHAYRPDIDGLRTIAITSVVLFHASFSWMSGGFIGVDVFFVISGYLITRLLVDEAESTGDISFSNFYSKRVKRLFPALVFLITSIILVWGMFFIGNPERTKHFLRSIRYGIFGFANFFFLKNSGGYFDANTEEMPLLHFWSLGVEEQFYFFWPLIVFLALKFGGAQKFRSKTKLLLLLIFISSLAYSEYLVNTAQIKEGFYSVFPRAWELSIGGLIYLFEADLKIKSRFIRELLSLSAMLLLFVCFVLFSFQTRFPGAFAILPTLATAVLIITALQGRTFVSKILSFKPFVYLGQLSYGWYLWHWPLLVFFRLSYHGEIPPLLHRMIAIIASLAIAAFSYHVVEKPFRSSDWIRKIKPQIILGLGLVISVLVVLSSQLLLKIEDRGMTDEWREILKLADERATYRFDCDFSLASRIDPSCVAHLKGEDSYIVVWGDSHAQAFFPVFEQLAIQMNKRAILMANSALPPVLGVDKIYYQNKPDSLDVSSYQQRVLNSLDPSKIYKMILIARWPAYVGTKPISVADSTIFLNPEKSSVQSLIQMEQGLKSLKNELESKGISNIYALDSFLEFKYEVKNCRNESDCQLSLNKFDDYRGETSKILKSVFLNRILDPTEIFCTDGICPIIFRNGLTPIPVVFDDDHVSVRASKQLESEILYFLNK